MGYAFYIASKSINQSISLCGVSCYKNKVKKSDTLFVLGPGASILDYSEDDFNHIAQFDSISINYAMLHEFIPTCYLFEIHDTQDKGYFRFLSKKRIKDSDAYFLIKGYNSWKKIFLFWNNVKDFSKSGARNLLLMKDGYLADYSKELTCQLSEGEQGDFFINHVASIIYCLDLAIKVRYQKVVFCGIDMNTDYFYFYKNYLTNGERKNLTRSRHLNKHSKSVSLENLVLDYFQKTDSMSSIEMYSLKGVGPLEKISRQYPVIEEST